MSNDFDYAHNNKNVIWMSQNTNHLPTHTAVQEAIRKSADEREYTKYPLASGLPELRDLILSDLSLPDQELHITNGGTEALYCLMRHIQPKGSEMITSDPSYFVVHKFAKLGGAKCTDTPIYNGNYRFDIEDIKEAINPKSKSIFLIDPINPLGSTYPREEKKAICDVAEDHNLWLIDDITYRDFAPNHTLAADLLPEKTITAYSVSKNCGLAGMRVGSLVGPKEFIRNIRGTMVSDLGINVVGQRASIAALKTKSEWLPGLVETALKNQTIIKNAVDKIDGVELPVYPSAASMMVIDISKHNANPQEVQDKLLYENDIFVRAGNYVSTRFGENFIRVSFSIPTPEVERFAEVFPIVMEELS
ncbi:MAG: aspartate aminotransferase [Methanobacteriota archaeon]|jgi:aspartate/methionine/tyrosine aminotransferase|nr:MAG: aspartate aminotransferase [Euryarchaeota archaeon]